jgi:hypothetical protein
MADKAAPIPLPSWESTDRYYLNWNVKCDVVEWIGSFFFIKYQINKHILKQYDYFNMKYYIIMCILSKDKL